MKKHIKTIAISATILITALILSNAFKNRNKSYDSISVTGLGSKDFVSDLIVWSGSFIKKNNNLKEAYKALDTDRENIKKYLVSKGINEQNIIFSSVNIDKEFDEVYDKNGNSNSIFTGGNKYTLSAVTGSVIMVAGLEFIKVTSIPSSRNEREA